MDHVSPIRDENSKKNLVPCSKICPTISLDIISAFGSKHIQIVRLVTASNVDTLRRLESCEKGAVKNET